MSKEPNRDITRKILTVFLNILFWIVICLFFLTNSVLRPASPTYIEEIGSVLMIAFIWYLNYFILYPYIYLTKRKVLYIPILLFLIAIITIIEVQSVKPLIKEILKNDPEILKQYLINTYLYVFLRNFAFVAFAVIYKLLIDNKQVAKLKIKNLEHEIRFQKQKTNTDFLFNSMNIIYASALNNDKNLSDLIITYSELLRHALDSDNDKMVPINTEIEFIKNYIDLERRRHINDIDVKLEIIGKYTNNRVPPMIYEGFINNAFKYGKEDGNGFINITLDISTTSETIFKCTNVKRGIINNKSQKNNGEEYSLKMLEDRLRLIYGKNYRMEIAENEEIYDVVLVLPSNILL